MKYSLAPDSHLSILSATVSSVLGEQHIAHHLLAMSAEQLHSLTEPPRLRTRKLHERKGLLPSMPARYDRLAIRLSHQADGVHAIQLRSQIAKVYCWRRLHTFCGFLKRVDEELLICRQHVGLVGGEEAGAMDR